ncbi:GDP-mannose 4,6-dehydratase [Candidatus Woesebacteria bacterium]|nr:MAG: GDP-mannose 4,6-dehydratase [Candidatus Woesebacteria bacterium]
MVKVVTKAKTASELKTYYKGKRVLVTGGLGFIGSSLSIKLVELGAEVTIIDSLVPDYGGNLFNIDPIKNKVNVNISDVRDKHSMNYLVQNKDIMFNLAGTLSHVDSMTDPYTDLDINCVSQLSTLEAVRHNNPQIKILFAGTRNQYGRAQYLPVDERHPLEPTDVNGININAGEYYHILYYKVYGIKSCSLRMTNTYGPRHQMKHPRQGVLNWFIRQVLDGEKVKLFGTGEQIRDTNFVDDVVRAFLLCGASEAVWGEVYNLGGIPVGLKGFAESVIKVHGRGKCETVPFPSDRKSIEIGDYIANYSKIKQTVGWTPKIELEEGIRKSLNYYMQHKDHYWKKDKN